MRSAISRVVLLIAITATVAQGQLRRDPSSGLTDAEFWNFFTSMSEPGGSFLSENFVSNEVSFQYPIPTLQRTLSKEGVYLGVGPEQNFTYIANLQPRMAVIFDIRRQNAMAHLMYKALFELSPTRAEFVSRLFSRPLAARVAPTARVTDMFAVAASAPPSDSAYSANQKAVFSTLVDKHRFALTTGDSAAIEHLMSVFYEAGPDINYGFRPGSRNMPRYATGGYVTYATLQGLTNADSVQQAFLASEELFRNVRDMHLKNLIVPVVGDFAGPKAIRAVGDYLRQRNMKVSAFYTSNVEQYLWQNQVAERFYDNVATLPFDSTSTFIRSVPPGGMAGPFVTTRVNAGTGSISFGGAGGSLGGFVSGSAISVSVNSINGSREITIVQDSAGQRITRSYRDSAGVLVPVSSAVGPSTVASRDSQLLRELRLRDSVLTRMRAAPGQPYVITSGNPNRVVVGGASLTSGIASMKATVDGHKAGSVLSYRDIITMTRISDWK